MVYGSGVGSPPWSPGKTIVIHCSTFSREPTFEPYKPLETTPEAPAQDEQSDIAPVGMCLARPPNVWIRKLRVRHRWTHLHAENGWTWRNHAKSELIRNSVICMVSEADFPKFQGRCSLLGRRIPPDCWLQFQQAIPPCFQKISRLPLAKRSSGSSHEQNWRTADSQYYSVFLHHRWEQQKLQSAVEGPMDSNHLSGPVWTQFAQFMAIKSPGKMIKWSSTYGQNGGCSPQFSMVFPSVFHGFPVLLHGFPLDLQRFSHPYRLDFSWSLGTFEPWPFSIANGRLSW